MSIETSSEEPNLGGHTTEQQELDLKLWQEQMQLRRMELEAALRDNKQRDRANRRDPATYNSETDQALYRERSDLHHELEQLPRLVDPFTSMPDPLGNQEQFGQWMSDQIDEFGSDRYLDPGNVEEFFRDFAASVAFKVGRRDISDVEVAVTIGRLNKYAEGGPVRFMGEDVAHFEHGTTQDTQDVANFYLTDREAFSRAVSNLVKR